MEQLLIVEDDIGLNQGLCKALKADDRQIISCHDLKAAREQLLCGGVSLILLDINLPDGSGLELLREVKENIPGVPVILLTANDTDLDIVDGLERGADDYITKPFSLSVLRARVNTQLRKQASSHKNAPIHMDLFHFDFEAMTFYVGDSKVELSKTEQKLLRLLVENRGRTMTRGDLVDRVWTDGAEYVDTPPPPSRASKRTSAAGFSPAGFSFSGSDISAGGSGALPVHLLLSVAQTGQAVLTAPASHFVVQLHTAGGSSFAFPSSISAARSASST